MLETTRRWLAAHPNWALTLATIAALAPFLSKPFNIDDPLFIWVAQQIYLHPGNPYGFDVNWAQTVFPMWHVTQNPPLACYYAALAAGLFGWNEIGLHLAFLLPAIAVVLGTRRLAGHFCRHPSLAALATLFTPVFLVSSMTVMCDVLMLAFWVWAAVLWVEGMDRDDFGRLALSGLCMAGAELTKYYGVCLVPLLAAYGLFHQRRAGRWMIYLLIPLAVLYGYQVATMALYGHNLLLNAVQYTSFIAAFEKENQGYSALATTFTALAFTGGCVSVTTLFAPLLWRRRALMLFGGSAFLLAALAVFGGAFGTGSGESDWTSPLLVKLQIILWTAGGAGVLALAGADVFQRRNAGAWLLFLWVAGTFSFAAFCNWTVNGRSILPLAPAVGILIARRLENKFPADRQARPGGVVICLAASAALAVLVLSADFVFARAARKSARETCSKLVVRGRTLWFQGNWGFQYYMDAHGARAIDLAHPALKPGDTFVVPANNTNLRSPQLDISRTREIFTVPKLPFLATMDASVGAGFYAALGSPLPFAFGSVLPERIAVFDFNGLLPAPASPTSPPP
jgi:4-amino-4-deoxy-L-arabinose transferase-like glycosyltransferase